MTPLLKILECLSFSLKVEILTGPASSLMWKRHRHSLLRWRQAQTPRMGGEVEQGLNFSLNSSACLRILYIAQLYTESYRAPVMTSKALHNCFTLFFPNLIFYPSSFSSPATLASLPSSEHQIHSCLGIFAHTVVPPKIPF